VDVLGIDISKADFHACLVQGNKRAKNSFPNSPTGYRRLHHWLKNRKSAELHVCMEATGAYWMGVAKALYESGVRVSVVNPKQTVNFARSQLRRTKTDAVDAAMIADYCAQRRPDPWTPPAPEILELRGLLSYRDELTANRTRLDQMVEQITVSRELQRLHKQQIKMLDRAIAAVEAQLRKAVRAHSTLTEAVAALTQVSGIGFLTAVTLIAKLPAHRLRDRKAAAAYVGLTPSDRQSGTSVHGKPRICKTGSGDLRRALYMPAIVASKHNAILRDFAQRLTERGKPGKVVIVAVMRKLVVLAFTILKRLPDWAPAVPTP
jgi:transposase